MISISGLWTGHFSQHGKKHRIEATFIVEGKKLTGWMVDLYNETTKTLYEAVAQSGLPPGSDEKIAEEIYQILDDVPKGPITLRSVLPTDSHLEGSVTDRFVRFVKSYRGNCLHEYEMGTRSIEHANAGHDVHYSGSLDQTGTRLEGEWMIHDTGTNGGYLRGPFVLQKSQEEEE